jgi:hypothetical protein
MPLQQSTASIRFLGGVDTKTDERQVPLGKFLLLKNAVFSAAGKIRKRYGYQPFSLSRVDSSTILSTYGGAGLFTRGSELLVADAGGNAASYDASNTGWVSKGTVPSVTATVQTLANMGRYSARSIDIAQAANGLICCVFEKWDNATLFGIYYTILDSTTGQVVVPPTVMDSTATYALLPRVVYLGTNFVCYYILGDLAATAAIVGRTLSSLTPLSAWSASTAMTSGAAAQAQTLQANCFQFDVCTSGSAGYISFNNTLAGTTVFRVGSSTPLAVSAFTSIAATGSTVTCVFPDVNGNIALGWIVINEARAAVFDSTLGSTVKASTIIDNALANYWSITGTSTAAGSLTFFIGNLPDSNTQSIRMNTLSGVTYGTTGTASTLIRSLCIASKAFTLNGIAYLPAWYTTMLGTGNSNVTQGCVFIIDSSGHAIGRALYNAAAGGAAISRGSFDGSTSLTFGAARGYMVGQTLLSGSTAMVGAATSTQITSGGLGFGTFSLHAYTANFVAFNFSDTTNRYLSAELAGTVHTSGSILGAYDGQNAVEHGFLLYPQFCNAGAPSAGGAIDAGAHTWAATYEWYDGLGQLHRSARAFTLSVTIVANKTVVITAPTLRVTAKGSVSIAIYRTLANGTTYYLLGTVANNPAADTVTFTDTTSDASISSGPQLYTTGGVLENYAAQTGGPLAMHRQRIFVADTTNPNQVNVSKEITPGAPVEFSAFLVITTIGPQAVKALGSMDDKLILFRANKITYLTGRGPDSTGGQNDWLELPLETGDIGCPYPKSVVQAKDGLIFQSLKGFWLLDRGLQLNYIGADVEQWNSSTVVGAFQTPGTTQVRFTLTTTDPAQLVFDYQVGQWSTFTSSAALGAATVWNNTHVTVGSGAGGPLWQETIGTYNDAGVFYSMSFTTPWIQLGQLEGYQRLWRILLLGKYTPDSQTSQTTSLVINHDFATTNNQTVSWRTPNNSPSFLVQIEVRPATQKCQALQLVWSDTWSGGAYVGAADEFSGITLEYGASGKAWRPPATARYG